MMSGGKRRGVRIGAYISGMLGNLALNEIGHILTEEYGAKIMINCDDIIIIARSKAEDKFLLNVLDRLCEERGIVIKASSYIAPIDARPLDYLGYVFTGDNMRLRKSIKKNFAEGLGRVKSRKRRKQISDSYKGWCMHGKCNHLWKTVMGFADKGIQSARSQTKDGQKFFDCRQVSLSDIVNVPMTVLDFQANIRTRDIKDRSQTNQNRYVVFVRLQNGEKVKFITNSYALKDVLDQCREAEENGNKVFPVENVTIKRTDVGRGITTYKFEDL